MEPEAELQNLLLPSAEVKDEKTKSTAEPDKNPESTTKPKLRRVKLLLALVGCIGLVCLIGWAIPEMATQNHVVRSSKLSHDFDTSCGNETICNIAAQEILQALNTSVDPCENFYEFACGGWISKNPIPDNKIMWMPHTRRLKERNKNLISILEDAKNESEDGTALSMAQKYFRECMTTQKGNNDTAKQNRERQFIREKLEQFGGWPILSAGKTWNSSQFDWIKSVVALQKEFEAHPLFVFQVRRKVNLSEGYLQFASPFTISIFVPVFTIEKNTQDVVDMFHTLSIPWDNTTLNEVYLQHVATEIAFTIRRFEVLDASYLEMDYNMEILPVQLLQERMNERNISVDLFHLLKEIYHGTGFSVAKTELVAVPKNFTYFEKMFEMISELGPEAMANFLHFQMAQQLVSLSSLKNVHKPEVNENADLESKQSCFDKTTEFFFNPLMLAYAEDQRMGDFSMAEKMFQNIKGKFWNAAFGSRSLGAQEKSVSEEIYRTTLCISPTRAELQSYYDGLQLSSSMGYMEQTLVLNSWTSIRILASMKVTIKPGCPWSKSYKLTGLSAAHLTLDAKYFVFLGLQEISMPFYDKSLPRSLIYGRIGFFLGHELVHGVNDTEFSSFPCLRKQYSALKHIHKTMHNLNVNGSKTLDENFADNAGMHAAYEAYLEIQDYGAKHGMKGLEDYTNDQLFFIGFAQERCSNVAPEVYKFRLLESATHAPEDVRVLGTLQNSDAFSAAWNCSVGSNMNPESKDKCKI